MAENLGSAVLELRTNDKQFHKGLKGAETGLLGLVNPITLVVGAVAGIGAAFFKVGNDSQQAMRTLANETGATGTDLKLLGADMEAAFAQVPESLGAVAKSMATLNTLTGATGPLLQQITVAALDASRAMGEDGAANAAKLGTALNQFSEPATNGVQRMEELVSASQQFGLGIGDLLRHLNEYGAVLQNAGFSMTESTDLFGQLAKAGLKVSRVMPGLNAFFRKNAEAGRDSQQALNEVIAAMQSAATSTDALKIATEAFGAEGAQRMTTAVRAGAFELENLGEALQNSQGIITQLTEDNKTLGEAFDELTNKASLLLEPIGSDLVEALTGLVEGLDAATDSSKTWLESLEGLDEGLRDAMGPLGDWIDAVEDATPSMDLFGIETDKANKAIEAQRQKINAAKPPMDALLTTVERLAAAEILAEAETKKLADAAELRAAVAAKNMSAALVQVNADLGRFKTAAKNAKDKVQSLASELKVVSDNRIHELEQAIKNEARPALSDLGAEIVILNPEINTLGIELGKVKNPLEDLKTPAEDLKEPLIQVSTVVTDLGKALADVVLGKGNFVDAITAMGQALVRSFIESGIQAALGAVFNKLSGIAGISLGGGSVPGVPTGGGVPGLPGGGGGGAGGGAGGFFDILGIGASVATAISSVFGNFQMAGMNEEIKQITHWTKLTAIALGGSEGTGQGGTGIRGTLFTIAARLEANLGTLPALWNIKDNTDFMQGSLDSMVTSLQTIAAKETVVNVTVTLDGKQLTAGVLDGIRGEMLLTPNSLAF